MSNPKLVLECPTGFKYNPYRNRVRAVLNGKNVSRELAALMNAAFPDDPVIGVPPSRTDPVMVVEGAEGFSFQDFGEAVRSLLLVEIEYKDGAGSH